MLTATQTLCALLGHRRENAHEDNLGARWLTCSRCGTVTATVSYHGGQPWRRKEQIREVGPNGWTCMCCSDYRPDHLISILTRRRVYHAVEVIENVRYCNDRPLCKQRAATLARKTA